MSQNGWEDLPSSGGGSSSNASVGSNGLPAPSSSTEVGFINAGGNLVAVSPTNPFPVDIHLDTVVVSENITQINSQPINVGVGAAGTGTMRVSTSSDSSLLANIQVGGTAVSVSNPIPVYDGYQAPTAATWTSATALNTSATYATSGMDTVVVSLVSAAGITGGVITFEVYDGAAWLAVKAPQIQSYSTNLTYTIVGAQSFGWQVPVAGFPQFRVRLSSVITGSGNVVITGIISSAPDVSLVTVGLDPQSSLPAGSNIIGKTGIDQTTPGVTNGVVVNSFADTIVSGSLAALNATLTINCAGLSTVGVDISGAWVGTITPLVQINGTFYPINFVDTAGGQLGLSWTANNLAQINVSGMGTLQLKMTAYTSGSATIKLEGSVAAGIVAINESLPQGANQIGTVGLVAGAATIGSIATVATVSAVTTLGNITGTVSLPTGASTSALQTSGGQKSQVVDNSGNTIGSLLNTTGALSNNYALAVAQTATNFFNSASNSSSAQLTAGATFTGVVENAYAQQAFSILMTSDQPITLTIYQYIDSGGTQLAQSNAFNVLANAGFAISFPINGNYVKVAAHNTGGSTTTTFNLSVTYGTIQSANMNGNLPVSIADVGGVVGGSLPVIATPATPPASPLFGHQTSSGTAVSIGSGALVNGVIIQALATNVGKVYIGGSAVTTGTGFELQAGQATSAAVANLSALYVIAASSGDGICYIGS